MSAKSELKKVKSNISPGVGFAIGAAIAAPLLAFAVPYLSGLFAKLRGGTA